MEWQEGYGGTSEGMRPRKMRDKADFVIEEAFWFLAASSFSVNTNPRLGSILRFMLTLNKAAFDIGIGGLGLRGLDYPC